MIPIRVIRSFGPILVATIGVGTIGMATIGMGVNGGVGQALN